MEELYARQEADELRALNEAETEAVSGGYKIDMGLFGELEIDQCVSWSYQDGDGGWTTVGQC